MNFNPKIQRCFLFGIFSVFGLLTSEILASIKLFDAWPGGFPQATASTVDNFYPQRFFCRFPFLEQFVTLADFDIFQVTDDVKKNFEFLSNMFNSELVLNSHDNQFHFTIFLFANIKNSKKLLSAKDSPWRVSLIVGDFEVKPESIDLIKEDSLLEASLGLLIDKKKKIYKIRFNFTKANKNFFKNLQADKPSIKIKYLNLTQTTELPSMIDIKNN